jgi:NodT family efflux transporter outer membrane factor (OMF) lipoprotein
LANRFSNSALVLLLPLLVVGACTGTGGKSGLDGVAVELPASFSKSVMGSARPDGKWWKDLGSRELDSWIERALAANGDIQAAQARLRRAEADLRAAGAERFPSLDATGGITGRSREETGGRRESSEGSLGLASSWEIDLWGRVRAGRMAAAFDTEAAAADLEAARISIAASVATLWADATEQTAQIRLLEEQKKNNQTGLEILELRNRRGQASSIDVAQQRQLVESVHGDIIVAQSNLAVTTNALLVLAGEMPASRAVEISGPLPEPKGWPPTGIPSEWVAGRPDLRASLARIAGAEERVAVAIADRFPRLRLNAFASADTPSWSGLSDAWIASIAADVVAPLLDGGARKAAVEAARARAAELAATFAQDLREAFGEVENAMVEEAAQRDLVASLEAQAVHARVAVERARAGYLRGTETYLRVLDAVRSLQSLDRRILTARRDRFVQRINLSRALARSPRP